MSLIEFHNVSEKYHIKFIIEKKVSWEEVWALRDVDFEVGQGEILGIIGQNGAGKTTVLKLIAGMIMPDTGRIDVGGKVAALMELGAGFNPEFTGKENIMVNSRIYGLEEDVLVRTIEQIIAFADLGKFIDAPVKYYSQGMYMRLAFALAIFVNPDILLIDDILAVGDEEAQQKCIKKILEFKQSGKTAVLVSHDMNMVSRLCNRVMLLKKGKVILEGSPEKVISHYLDTSGDTKGIATLEKNGLRLVFNNGRIGLNYNGVALTKRMAGYLAFFLPSFNIWVSSAQLDWDLKACSENKIIAEGKFSDGSFIQNWTLILQDNSLNWQAEIKGDVNEPHIGWLFLPQYNQWLTLEQRGYFPPFIHKSNWQDIGPVSCPGGILGISSDSDAQALPNLIFSTEDKEAQIKILNTGFELECHVIQLPLNNNNFISSQIRAFPSRDRFEDYLNEKRSQLKLK